MKILYSCLSRSWGGMEMFTVHAVQQLLKRNIQTELLCYPDSKIHHEAIKSGIVTHRSRSSGYFHLIESIKISKLIKEGKFNLVHSQASKDLWVLVPALKIANVKIPLLLTKQMGSFIVKKDFLHKFIYKRLDVAFAISNVIKQNLIDTTPLNESKIKLLHNAVDTKKFDPDKVDGNKIRNEFYINENEILIGMMARFSKGKGHEEFLFAANELLKKYDNLKFMIVGEASRNEENYAKEIKSLVENYGIKDKVIFTGFRSDTPEILGALNIFVFPSHSEAFGIALAEALAMGKPSVCSKSDGVLDIAVDGVTSYLFEKQNAKDLKEKIEILINSETLRNEFGLNARKRAVENFDIDYLTDKVIDYYNEIIQAKRNQI